MEQSEKDWWAILQAVTNDMQAKIANCTLLLPAHIVVIGSDDEVVADYEFRVDAAGGCKCVPLSPPSDRLLSTVPFPVLFTVEDGEGQKWEAVFSEEVVRQLRKVA